MMLLYSSGPSNASVAPHGGVRAVFTPNPIAVGYPTESLPVLVDVSTSLTSNALVNRSHKEGRRLPHPWLLDDDGKATDDPGVFFPPHKGTILPLGGLDSGHKGYGLTLMVEAMTSGLAGHGRADPQEGWGASVFLQILDPAAFSGLPDFTRQTEWISRACLESPPRPGFDRVRLPGHGGLSRREKQLKDGVELTDAVMSSLAPWPCHDPFDTGGQQSVVTARTTRPRRPTRADTETGGQRAANQQGSIPRAARAPGLGAQVDCEPSH